MTRSVVSRPSITALQNDQLLRHSIDIRLTGFMERQPASLLLDVDKLDDPGPLLGLVSDGGLPVAAVHGY